MVKHACWTFWIRQVKRSTGQCEGSGQVKKQQQGKTPAEVEGQGEEGSGCEKVIQS